MRALMEILLLIFGRAHELNSWQMSARAIVVVIYGVLLLRAGGRRIFARSSPVDLVFIIVVGSNLSRAVTGNAPMVPVMAATAAMFGFYWLIMRAAFRWQWVRWLTKGTPIRLVVEGRVDEQAMHDLGFTRGDLEEEMRKHGIDSLEQIGTAQMEPSGNVTIVRRSADGASR